MDVKNNIEILRHYIFQFINISLSLSLYVLLLHFICILFSYFIVKYFFLIFVALSLFLFLLDFY